MRHIESTLWALLLLTMNIVLPSSAQAEGGHRLTVMAKPAMAGSFNTNAAELVAGQSIQLVAYANANFTFLRWTDDQGNEVPGQMEFTYVMPAHDVTLTAEYEYNPVNPANPAQNYWNKELGEVIVDDFTTGVLQNAVKNVIGDSKAADVMTITVAGVMNANDFGVINTYSACTLLDLSRVTGVLQVPSYAFDYTNLESVYLPATIEKIGYRAFYECKQLLSLVVYAMTPPTLENNVFTGVPEGLMVYVPAAAIAQYQEADGWKDFTILPIQEDIRSISISLPEGANVADYAQMWLELTNTKSGQRMHYVMTDRTQYTFANIIRNTSWNVTLRNERGDVFGQIDNVEVGDEDVAVVFSKLSKPQKVSLVVQTPDGQEVTSQAQITWTDAQGSYMAQGASLTGLPVGYQANYRVTLSQELAMQYDTPQAVEYVLKDGGNNIVCQLQAIKQLQISGKVKDAATGLPLSGVTISASQTFGGKYSKTLNAKTDNSGVFTLTIANVPTSVAFAASDYVSQTVDLSNYELSELSEFAVPDVSLKSITGATINIGFTYTPVEGEAQNWYSDYQNVSYTLYNITREKPISLFNVHYPQIVLLEEVEDGDVLRLQATSRTNAFMPVETTATIAEQKAEATFGIVELGQIRSSFSTTGNASVVGSLYDADGKLVKTYDYANALLTISNLADGNYTLVTMGSSRLFNTIYDLAQLSQTGLAEGADYVVNTVDVKSGAISQIVIDEVPTLDESKLYYTGENTSFTVNKPSIVAGNYLTLTGRIDFKPAYATSVSNVQMIVDLPESCEFVENSVMVGNSTSSYTLNGCRITIPMTRYTDRVRFCIIPTLGGEYAPSAFAQFDINGETVTQPIGSANYTAKDLSISVPSTVAKTTISVSGTAIGTSNIEIYDNDVLIGQTTSLANGTWATACELNEPYNLSSHSIYAKVTTKQGLDLKSETMDCIYDMDAIEVKTVTMINTAHGPNDLSLKDYVTVFDFQNPQVEKKNYWYWPNYPLFTFLIDFSNNDPGLIDNVSLKVIKSDNTVEYLKANYSLSKKLWVASGKYNSYSLPINVGVAFNTDLKLTSESITSAFIGSLLEERDKDIMVPDTISSSEHECVVKFSTEEETYYLKSTMEAVDNLEDISSYTSIASDDTLFILTRYDGDNVETCISADLINSLDNTICQNEKEILQRSIKGKKFLRYRIVWIDTIPLEKASVKIKRAPGSFGAGKYLFNVGKNEYDINKQAKDTEKMLRRIARLRNCDLVDEGHLDMLEERLNRAKNTFAGSTRIGTLAQGPAALRNNPATAALGLGGNATKTGAKFGSSINFANTHQNLKIYENACGYPPIDDSDHQDSNDQNAGYVQDPSGYVYEGVASNRIEGVTATAYYKEMVEDMYGDLHENIVKWDASEYAQENPLFTDEYGMYAWDVPQGLWQVKFEKEGYETTYSEWLPVPPPQLDVNIAMKQNRQPEVKAARAYEDAVEVEFDKYMMPELLTMENIMVMQNGTAVEGTVELLNEESAYEGSNESFASKIRFNAAQPFTEQEITLLVNNRVKSYAGIRMQDNYEQTFTIEQEIKQIVSDSVVTVGYGNTSTLTVSVLPASASKGKMLTVKTSSPMILSVETEQVTIGNDGKAEITVSGELPGTAALTFTVEGTDKTATTIANVEHFVIKTVATPKASIASGSTVEKGTAITLTCETEGATIYYTLDGSCPCDDTDARKVYDGTPIIINESVTIKAMAVAPDMYESDVVEFTYIVEGTGIDDITVNDQIQIYPLPVHDKVNISAGGKAIKSVTISSMNGVVVASANKPATTVTLDVSRIPAGIYIINVTTVDSTFSRKILKVE